MSLPNKHFLQAVKDGCILMVYARPNAKKSALSGEYNAHLKIQIAAVPEDGRANAALIEYLSEIFELSQKSIKIIKGSTAKNKQVFLSAAFEDIQAKINNMLEQNKK